MRGRRFLLDWTVIDNKKKKKTVIPILVVCSGVLLSLFLFLIQPQTDGYECISSMRGITYEEVHAPDAKTTSQGEFFFSFFLYVRRKKHAH